MICCTMRSSSVGTLDFCEMKFALTYNFGEKDKNNKKAILGVIVHRAMQVLGDKSIAKQNKKRKVINDDIPSYSLSECDDLDKITEDCFNYYIPTVPELVFDHKDLKTCQGWVRKAVEYDDCKLDPRNQNVVVTEKYFEIELDKPWAKYSYEIGGSKIEGPLILRGTVDLIVKEDEEYFQVLDYKTGKRLNWATGEEKTQDCLQKDFQLLFYYYALKNLYPTHKFYVSIYYINDGGLFDVVFDESDYLKAENMIKQKFMYINSVELPRLLSPDNKHWKCKYLCAFSEPSTDAGMSVCQQMHNRIRSYGYLDTLEQYGDLTKLNSYGSGGGRIG